VRCANCDHERINVDRTCRDTSESILRKRKCPECGHTVFTVEVELPDGFVKHDRNFIMRRLPGCLRVHFS